MFRHPVDFCKMHFRKIYSGKFATRWLMNIYMSLAMLANMELGLEISYLSTVESNEYYWYWLCKKTERQWVISTVLFLVNVYLNHSIVKVLRNRWTFPFDNNGLVFELLLAPENCFDTLEYFSVFGWNIRSLKIVVSVWKLLTFLHVVLELLVYYDDTLYLCTLYSLVCDLVEINVMSSMCVVTEKNFWLLVYMHTETIVSLDSRFVSLARNRCCNVLL